MMKQMIDFVKCNPTQNMTILINTMLPRDEHKRIASKIMSYDNVYAEQVGFIEPTMNQEADAFLQMAGGEFCGNACMALAAFLANEHGLEHYETNEIRLEVSGAERLVTCLVTKNREDFQCRVDMPLPEKIEQTVLHDDRFPIDMVVVKYKDFIHFVIEVERIDTDMKYNMLSLAKLIGPFLDTSMLGILLYNNSTHHLTPLIYVHALNSAVWERGCGSGTASIGAYLAWKNKRNIETYIHQPGGTMLVKALYGQDRLTRLEIEGSVGIVAQGTAFIDTEVNLSAGEGIHEVSRV